MKLHELREKIDRQIKHLSEELATVRSGRATSALVENIKVDAYEGSAPLTVRELATISISEPTIITIKPWDVTLSSKIEKAIRVSPGGLNPVVFDDLIRINLPPLSQERRQEMAKVVKSKAEATKVELRQIRQDEMRSIDEMEKNGVISEDDRFSLREEVEKTVKEKTEEVEKIAREKEAELMKV